MDSNSLGWCIIGLYLFWRIFRALTRGEPKEETRLRLYHNELRAKESDLFKREEALKQQLADAQREVEFRRRRKEERKQRLKYGHQDDYPVGGIP